MPSNSFKISQLVAFLKTMQDQHGDLDVTLPVDVVGRQYPITEKDIVPATSFQGAALPVMVLAIAPRDPIVDYAVTAGAVGDNWIYAFDGAPTERDVAVYKRFGGQDKGRWNGATWAVYEGGDRAWEVPTGGVLAWREL